MAVGYLFELVPTSREDDRFGVISKVLAFVRNGRYPERTFLFFIGDPGRDDSLRWRAVGRFEAGQSQVKGVRWLQVV
ncbi:hypothetical protein TNCV_346741 [Trichonephila clavipes]|nr:hypothetical protein TNCV_346741 [Trichonephila clavipes]